MKKELFHDLDRTGQPTILATDTSTLPVIDPAWKRGGPSGCAACTSSIPAPVMALVKVVQPLTACKDTMAAVHAFASARQDAGRSQGPGRASS